MRRVMKVFPCKHAVHCFPHYLIACLSFVVLDVGGIARRRFADVVVFDIARAAALIGYAAFLSNTTNGDLDAVTFVCACER